jgi:hypothetical protein
MISKGLKEEKIREKNNIAGESNVVFINRSLNPTDLNHRHFQQQNPSSIDGLIVCVQPILSKKLNKKNCKL